MKIDKIKLDKMVKVLMKYFECDIDGKDVFLAINGCDTDKVVDELNIILEEWSMTTKEDIDNRVSILRLEIETLQIKFTDAFNNVLYKLDNLEEEVNKLWNLTNKK